MVQNKPSDVICAKPRPLKKSGEKRIKVDGVESPGEQGGILKVEVAMTMRRRPIS